MRSIKRWARVLAAFAIAAWSLEIVLRRAVWGQVPTQVPDRFVQALLVFNALCLARLAYRAARGGVLKKA